MNTGTIIAGAVAANATASSRVVAAAGANGNGRSPLSAQAVADLHFVAAVAEFGMLLRHSGNAGSATWESVRALAEAGRGADRDGYRAEFLRLVGIAQSLSDPNEELRALGYSGDQPSDGRR